MPIGPCGHNHDTNFDSAFMIGRLEKVLSHEVVLTIQGSEVTLPLEAFPSAEWVKSNFGREVAVINGYAFCVFD